MHLHFNFDACPVHMIIGLVYILLFFYNFKDFFALSYLY